MSNPAVFELNRSKIKDNIFIIEDNIGESIHFHIGMVRFDLSIKEFLDVSSTLLNVLENLVDVKDFILAKQDEFFLARIASSIPYIQRVEMTNVQINYLKYRYEADDGKIVEASILDTPAYRYYQGDVNSLDEYDFEKEIWQTNREILDYVKENNCTPIYVDENLYILDGYKSACALLKEKGEDYVVNVKMLMLLDGKAPQYILNKVKKPW